MKHNENHPNEKILKSKIGLLCDTRWVERHTFFADFSVLYEPLLDALQAITSSAGYDTKAVTEANGLFHQITTSGFIFCICGVSICTRIHQTAQHQAAELTNRYCQGIYGHSNCDRCYTGCQR